MPISEMNWKRGICLLEISTCWQDA